MTDFEKWKARYDKNWITKQQLKTIVQLQVFTAAEYEQITGEVYIA